MKFPYSFPDGYRGLGSHGADTDRGLGSDGTDGDHIGSRHLRGSDG